MTQKVVSSKLALLQEWDQPVNFRLMGECVPFSFVFPPIEEMVDAIRKDSAARILRGRKGPQIEEIKIDKAFRDMPLDQALQSEFHLSHFHLSRFYGANQILYGFEEQVMVPWREFLSDMGWTWSRCTPYFFISGRGCATNYHMDVSHVIFWQIWGTKVFHGLQEPERWAPMTSAVRRDYRDKLVQPTPLGKDDILAYEMAPGDVLWNQLLTPHWVEASDEVACSLLISHGGLRLRRQLSHREACLEEWLRSHPTDSDAYHLQKFN